MENNKPVPSPFMPGPNGSKPLLALSKETKEVILRETGGQSFVLIINNVKLPCGERPCYGHYTKPVIYGLNEAVPAADQKAQIIALLHGVAEGFKTMGIPLD